MNEREDQMIAYETQEKIFEYILNSKIGHTFMEMTAPEEQ